MTRRRMSTRLFDALLPPFIFLIFLQRNSVPTTPQRFRNSTTPPSSARRAIYSDRFIPSRTTTKLEEAFDLFGEEASSRDSGANKNETQMESQILMNNLIRTELLGQSAIDINLEMRLEGTAKSPNRKDSGSSANLFKYRLSQGSSASTIDSHHTSGSEYESPVGGFGPTNNVNRSSIISPKKPTRKIPKNPFKVLDAPSLQDDYYLNLVDWSHHNVLSVALCSSVYLWSACTSKVTKLCDFGSSDMVTSISWALTGRVARSDFRDRCSIICRFSDRCWDEFRENSNLGQFRVQNGARAALSRVESRVPRVE